MGGAVARASVVEFRSNYLPNAIHVSEHLVVPEPQDSVTLTAHDVVAPKVVGARIGVLTAINFDHQHRFQTAKSAM